MEARNNEIRLEVEDQQAQYPLTVDPFWTQQQKLTDPEETYNDNFGYSVAISGPIAVIGAAGRKVGNNLEQGAAYVFVLNGSTWTQQQELTVADGQEGSSFGYSVAVSGTTALIGAPGYAVDSFTGPYDQGAAYVFVQNGTTWSQQQKLQASDAAPNSFFGTSIALSGTTAVITAPQGNGNPEDNGQGVAGAYIFVQSGTTWIEQKKLTASDGAAGDDFGYSVALSGTSIIVGAPLHNARQGAAYVFLQISGFWAGGPELTADDGAPNDEFGCSVAVSGTTAVIGARFHSIDTSAGNNFDQGAAYVYVQNGITWSPQQELEASDAAHYGYFGTSVAVSGTTAIIGAPGSGGAPGAAYVFTQSNGAWSQQEEMTNSDASTYGFGVPLAMSGTTALVGVSIHNELSGAIYVFAAVPTLSPATLTTPSPGSTLTGSSVEFAWSAVEGIPFYNLHLSAIGPGGSDLYSSGAVAGPSVTVTGLPTNGAKIYARLYSWISGGWQYTDSTYTAFTAQTPVMTSPAPGSTLTGPSATFTWTAASSGNQGYWLFLGTQGAGSQDLYDSHQQTATSATFSGLPTNGKTIYARIYTRYNGVLVYNDYTYTAWMQPPVMTSPTPGSTFAGSSATFTWTAASPGNQGYWLFLGTTGVGSQDLYDSHQQAATSATFSSLPTNGQTIYARVYTRYNGVLVYNDYTYTAQ
jgi:hypothetical protein